MSTLPNRQNSLLITLGLLVVAIAALWHTLLAPAHRGHRAYALSGWYLAAFSAVAVLLGLLHAGITTPLPVVSGQQTLH